MINQKNLMPIEFHSNDLNVNLHYAGIFEESGMNHSVFKIIYSTFSNLRKLYQSQMKLSEARVS